MTIPDALLLPHHRPARVSGHASVSFGTGLAAQRSHSDLGARPEIGFAAQPHFGNAATAVLDPLTQAAFKGFGPLANNPGLRFIGMDIVGWGGLRTLVDLHRENFYLDHIRNWLTGNQDPGQSTPKTNVAAAFERIQREISATVNDVLLAGPLVAVGTAWAAANHLLPYGANFIDRDLMARVQQHAHTLASRADLNSQRGSQALDTLYSKLSEDLLHHVPSEHHGAFKALLTAESLQQHATARSGLMKPLTALVGGTSHEFNALPLAEKMANLMGQPGNFSVSLKNATSSLKTPVMETSLPHLLDNFYKVQAQFLKQAVPTGAHWAEHLSGKLKTSLKAHMIFPLALFLPVVMNLIMPHEIQANSVKKFGITSYPGDESTQKSPYSAMARSAPHLAYGRSSLANAYPQNTQSAWQQYNNQPWQDKYFKFLKSAWDNKNPLPFLGAAAFVPFVLGLYKAGHGFKFALPKSLKPTHLKEFFADLSKRHAFDVAAPWASEQQQATSYAATLFSRIVTARTPMEFIERLTESFASYATGFELTPTLNAKLAKSLSGNGSLSRVFQKVTGLSAPDLIKADGSLRSTQEVLSMKHAATRKASLTAQTWLLNWGMTIFNTLAMGVAMPIACIMLATIPRLMGKSTSSGFEGPQPKTFANLSRSGSFMPLSSSPSSMMLARAVPQGFMPVSGGINGFSARSSAGLGMMPGVMGGYPSALPFGGGIGLSPAPGLMPNSLNFSPAYGMM